LSFTKENYNTESIQPVIPLSWEIPALQQEFFRGLFYQLDQSNQQYFKRKRKMFAASTFIKNQEIYRLFP